MFQASIATNDYQIEILHHGRNLSANNFRKEDATWPESFDNITSLASTPESSPPTYYVTIILPVEMTYIYLI